MTLFEWFKGLLTFQQPMMSLALALVIAALATVVWMTNQPGAQPDGREGAPAVATDNDPPRLEQQGPKGQRRGREAEGRYASTEAYVDGQPEVAIGTARVEFGDDNDPETPLVLWHEIEGEGTDGAPENQEQGL